MTDIAADKAELIALFFETFLYGMTRPPHSPYPEQ